ncbi:MAG: hypothetical protein FJ146_08450 [Deltaproteobacteria bacterium]|nr:hypothetical protein [Deltaproteobacteria bacterium]
MNASSHRDIDCSSDSQFFYVIGHGSGASQTVAAQSALLDARKNAILCVFGGVVSYDSHIKGTADQVEASTQAHVSVTGEHIDWGALELLKADDSMVDGVYSSVIRLRWPKPAIAVIKAKRDVIKRERTKNAALAREVEAAKRQSAEQEALLQARDAELREMRRHQYELLSAAAKHDRVLASIERQKREQEDLDREWLHMALKLGCGVTIKELKPTLGRPSRTEVYVRQESSYRYRPLLYFVYGNFALVAPVYDVTWLTATSRGTELLIDQAWRYQITQVVRYRGDGSYWVVCDEGR